MKPYSHPARRAREGGYVLLVIMLALALLMIGMLAAAPSISTQIKRDREQEMIHRGQQYAIAIKRYYKKFGRYPVKISDLENTSNMRFLRRAYKNPTDPKGEWRILHMGEVKTQLKMPGAAGAQLPGTPAGMLGSSAAQPSVFSPGPSQGTQNPQASSMGGAAAGGTPQAGQPSMLGQTAAGTTTGSQVFGGAPIVGVAGTVDKPSIIAWHDKTTYKDWEFFYDPRLDTNAAAGTGVPGGTAAGTANPAAPGGPGMGMPTGATPNPMGGPGTPPPMPPQQAPH